MAPAKRSGFNRYEPPSPSLAGDEDVEESFLKNVNKLHDLLPQPFRRIDKLLSEIYELAWEEIEKRESEKIHKESAKINLHKVVYEEELLVKEAVRCIGVSPSFLFLGSTNKIIVYELPDLKFVCVYDWLVDDDKTNSQSNVIEYIHVAAYTHEVVILISIDNNGYLKILGFTTDSFVNIDSLNALDSNGVLVKAESSFLSDDGSFLAVTWKDTSNLWLDVYKLPTELWFQEIPQLTKEVDEETPPEEDQTPPQTDLHKVMHQFKLSCREVKVNVLPLSGVMKNFHADTPLVGTGAHHCLLTSFFKNLSDEFKIKCKVSPPETFSFGKPYIHFLKGQLNSSLFSTHSPADAFNAVAVWWEGSNQLSFFHLKQLKDQPEPFFVLPHSDIIKLSCINSQTNLIATFVANRCVTIWNRYLGHPIKVFRPDQEITMLDFSTVYDGTTAENRLTYVTSNGKLWQATCNLFDIETPVCLEDRSSPVFENNHFISRVHSPNNLLTLIWSCGQIIIYNEITSSALCQLEIFNDDSISNGHVSAAYIDKYIVVMREETLENSGCSRFFLFQIDKLPILQTFNVSGDFKTSNGIARDATLRNYFQQFVEECRKYKSAHVEAQHQVLLKT